MKSMMHGGLPPLSRRRFIHASLTAAGGLLVAASLPAGTCRAASDGRLNAFIELERDGRTIIGVSQPDMGQGMYSTLSMLVAEELDADWSRVAVRQLPLMLARDDEGNVAWKHVPQGAGGSYSVVSLFQPLRQLGARARRLLMRAAAERWAVPLGELHTEPGRVVHDGSGREAAYADLVEDAAALDPDETPPVLKSPDRFRLIGTEVAQKKLDEVVDGSARYGIDVSMPGMRHAVIARCPYFDGALLGFDDTETRKVRGVIDVVPVEGPAPGAPYSTMAAGVAVVADSTWAAMKGREALRIRWDEGPHREESTASLDAACQAALDAGHGETVRHDGDFDGALETAAAVVTRRYRLPYVHHATMEPQNCYADVGDDRATVIGPMQMPASASRLVASLTGLDRLAIDVRMSRLGGGCGRRLRPAADLGLRRRGRTGLEVGGCAGEGDLDARRRHGSRFPPPRRLARVHRRPRRERRDPRLSPPRRQSLEILSARGRHPVAVRALSRRPAGGPRRQPAL